MKIFAALGPGDIVGAHRKQITASSVTSETSIVYSGQLLEFCRFRGMEILAVSHHPRADHLLDGVIEVENRPIFMASATGLMFHAAWMLRGIYLAYRARRFGADFALINSGSTHYFALAAFWLFGIPTAVDFHNALWPAGSPEKGFVKRTIRALDGLYFRLLCFGTMGVSEECGRQVQALAQREIPFFGYKSQFRAEEFSNYPVRMPMEDGIFRLTFAGRVEQNKGALDLITIADLLRSHPVKIDVCGGGPSLGDLQKQAREKKLDSAITIHGALERPALLGVYRNSDAVIVPTRSDFAEGLPRACVEAALCGLPIVTSKLSNALDSLGPAIVEAEPDIAKSYAEAILTLVKSPKTCLQIRTACPTITQPFLNRDNGLASAFDRLLALSSTNWKPLSSYAPTFERLV